MAKVADNSDAARGDYYQSLDLVRGIAALAVVVFHASPTWDWSTLSGPWKVAGWVTAHGWFGVHLFFVVSGYCIAAAAAREHERGHVGGRFLFDRAWRIFPVYWAALLCAIAFAVAAVPFNHAPLVSTSGEVGALPESASHFGVELALLAPWLRQGPYLDVSWTLTVELGFYLLTAVGLALAKALRTPIPVLGLAVGLALVIAIRPGPLAHSPLAFWPEFVCGAAIWLGVTLRRRHPARAVWCWVAIAVLGACGVIWDRSPHTLPWAAGLALLLAALHRFDLRVAVDPRLRWLRWAGAISYSLYLIHQPVVGPLRNLIGRVWPKTDSSFILVSLVLVLLALAVAAVFYRWVEAPLERGRKSFRHRTAPVDAPPRVQPT